MSITNEIRERAAAIKAARVAGTQPADIKLSLPERLGQWAAKSEDSAKRAASDFLDTRRAMRDARIEEGCRW